jgi:hypothetical protein
MLLIPVLVGVCWVGWKLYERHLSDVAAMKRFESLAGVGRWTALVEELDQLRPGARNHRWDELVVQSATQAVAAVRSSESDERALQLLESLIDRYPLLMRDSTYIRQRGEVAVEAARTCYASVPRGRASEVGMLKMRDELLRCTRSLLSVVDEHGEDQKLTSRAMRVASQFTDATPFLERALARVDGNKLCEDAEFIGFVEEEMRRYDDKSSWTEENHARALRLCPEALRAQVLKTLSNPELFDELFDKEHEALCRYLRIGQPFLDPARRSYEWTPYWESRSSETLDLCVRPIASRAWKILNYQNDLRFAWERQEYCDYIESAGLEPFSARVAMFCPETLRRSDSLSDDPEAQRARTAAWCAHWTRIWRDTKEASGILVSQLKMLACPQVVPGAKDYKDYKDYGLVEPRPFAKRCEIELCVELCGSSGSDSNCPDPAQIAEAERAAEY